MKRIQTIIQKSSRTNMRLLLLGIASAGVMLLAGADDQHAGHGNIPIPAKLVQDVRVATAQYANVSAATAASYQPLFGCVSGPDQGAMGIHYINLALYSGGVLDVTRPVALIYEPSRGGLALVGVEYIVDAAGWLAKNSAPPMLDGQAFLLVDSPNRFGLPAFFELHVWAWRDSPNGAFVDWNTQVSCEGQ
jgi:hypothetical protein